MANAAGDPCPTDACQDRPGRWWQPGRWRDLTEIEIWSHSIWGELRRIVRLSLTAGNISPPAFEIEWGIPIQIPMIDIHTIGAGGGSIAWIDKGGMLRVGPQSAGSVTRGRRAMVEVAREPTVTDANLVAGRLNPNYFLGGRMALDPDAAVRRGRACRANRSKCRSTKPR